MPNITYPLDLSGSSSSSYVTNELHTVQSSMIRDYNLIVPNFAPFFANNFVATITSGNNTRELVEDVDYSLTLAYVTGTRTTGKPMYGAMTVHNLPLNGIISISYQTIGGNQVADRLAVLTLLAEKSYNPRVTIWDILTGIPQHFPPTPHYQDYEQFFGQEEVVFGLNEIRDAILQNSSLTREVIEEFLLAINTATFSTFLRKTGDVMSGRLLLAQDPVEDLEAVTKRYLEHNSISSDELNVALSAYLSAVESMALFSNKVSKTGDSMSGQLVLSGLPLEPEHAANKRYVDSVNAGIQAQLTSISNSLNGVYSDNVTKSYVDNRINEVLLRIDRLSTSI